MTVKGEMIQLLLYSTSFRQRNQLFKLVAIQNILPELEEKEIEAYQKLIRVLTHEIMNSITPIASLASTASTLAGKTTQVPHELEKETIENEQPEATIRD
jgi:hypothetical protein